MEPNTIKSRIDFKNGTFEINEAVNSLTELSKHSARNANPVKSQTIEIQTEKEHITILIEEHQISTKIVSNDLDAGR